MEIFIRKAIYNKVNFMYNRIMKGSDFMANFALKMPEEYKSKIKALAKKAGLTQTDFVIYKCLNLLPAEIKEERTYPHQVKKPDGKVYNYKRKKLVTVKKYVPVKENTPSPEISEDWFEPVTNGDIELARKIREETKGEEYISDEELDAILSE